MAYNIQWEKRYTVIMKMSKKKEKQLCATSYA